MHSRCCRNSLHCLIPPQVVRRVAARGNQRQRTWALEMLDRDATIRMARLQNAARRDALGMPHEAPDALGRLSMPSGARLIFNAHNRPSTFGSLNRWEGQQQERPGQDWDDQTNEAFDGLGDTRDFYAKVFQRNSIDDEGMALVGVIHYSRNYGNAFWDGRRMVFGDGDGEVFTRLTKSIDVIGHELTHGVTEKDAGLNYVGESGALNESVSDVFGSLVKQFVRGETADEANWLIGEDVWTPGISGDALRSLKAPGTAYDDPLVGKDDQPAKMSDYVHTTQDNGGVHINSGIPNHAFYLIATKLGGNAWERAGLIWYEALRDAQPNTNFTRFADLTVDHASALFGPDSDEVAAVQNGWNTVGVVTSKRPLADLATAE
jgi:Zn-dependent metalloprotease